MLVLVEVVVLELTVIDVLVVFAKDVLVVFPKDVLTVFATEKLVVFAKLTSPPGVGDIDELCWLVVQVVGSNGQ